MAESQTWKGDAADGSPDPMAGLRDTVASAAEEQKDRAADQIEGVADVARHTSEELRGQNELLASWVHIASDQLRLMADRLRDRQPGELAEDLTRFARQRPLLFIGGAFLVGVGLARLPRQTFAPARREARMPPVSRSGPDAYAREMGVDPGNTWSPGAGV